MRLINTETGKFEEFVDSSTAPLYAILSHTWEKPPGREQSYQDVVKIQQKYGLHSSLLEEEATSNYHVNDPIPPRQAEVLSSSEPGIPTQSELSESQLPHISLSMFSLLGSLFFWIIARRLLYFLLNYPPLLEPQVGVQTPDADVLDEQEPHTPSDTAPSIRQADAETAPLSIPPILEQTEPPNDAPATHPSATLHPIWNPDSGISEKIRKACEVARRDGYRYIWVDSSCIDKTSSSELSEAINSMFAWYRDAQICYAFLSDVPSDDDVRAKGRQLPWYDERADEERSKDSKFRTSRWFKRAWTLQELIAPRMVVFLSQDWKGLGTKHSLADLIEDITRIDRDILTHKKALAEESVAERMRWAAEREATRVEDEAYSLLGIFGITMTTIYGEGQHAFQRLQEEILQRIPDRSLFAWCGYGDERPIQVHQGTKFETFISIDKASPFAKSPRVFSTPGGKISALSEQNFASLQLPVEEYALTPHGIRTKICLIPMKSLAPDLRMKHYGINTLPEYSEETWYLILLGTQLEHSDHAQNHNHLLGRLCCVTCSKSSIQLLEVPDGADALLWTNWADLRLDTQSLIGKPLYVYFPRPTLSIAERKPEGDKPNESQSTTVSFSPLSPSAMPPRYTISEWRDLRSLEDRYLQPHGSPPLSLLLSTATSRYQLFIQYRHMLSTQAWSGGGEGPEIHFGALIEARIWILSSNSTLDGSPPYASAIWSASEAESTLPIWYIPVPITQSGEELILRLWLGIAKYGHYTAHVEVAMNHHGHRIHIEHQEIESHQYLHVDVTVVNGSQDYFTHTDVATGNGRPARSVSRRSLASQYETAPLRIPEPHPDFKFTLLGSDKRALEAQGYFVNLESPGRTVSGNSRPHSHSLVISDLDSTFTISIKYFHNRRTCPGERFPQFILVASVTLESVPGHGSQRFHQDGPYVLNWADHYRWSWDDEEGPCLIYLTTPTEDVLVLKLDVDRAWVSEYYLVVNLTRHGDSCPKIEVSDYRSSDLQFRLVDPHDHVSLTLPTQISRALQEHGYRVHFEGSQDHPHHLTLSDAKLTIHIEYSYDLSMGSDGQQKLTFRARVTTSASELESPQDAATQADDQIVDWDAQETWKLVGDQQGRGWCWNLPQKDVKLEPPNRPALTLRLSLYLLWLSEYCIMVEVNPPTPLSRTSSYEYHVNYDEIMARDSESDEEEIDDDASTKGATEGEADGDEDLGSDEVTPVARPIPATEDAQVKGVCTREQGE